MKITQTTWPISRASSERQSINLNPLWQRGPTWKSPRQVLLIDSILRGMDIPKVYLRKLAGAGAYKFDAVDGQQRLRAIWMFHADDLRLEYSEALPPIEHHTIDGKTFSELHPILQKRFTTFEITVRGN